MMHNRIVKFSNFTTVFFQAFGGEKAERLKKERDQVAQVRRMLGTVTSVVE